MVCELGYKQVAKVRVPQPQPQQFKAKIRPPEIDKELLAKIGEEDSKFLEWLLELDMMSLLQEALKRMQQAVKGSEKVTASITSAGMLDIQSTYMNADQKKTLETLTEKMSARFQMEVLKIVAELLDYETVLSQSGNQFIIEGERHDDSPVHKYLRISVNSDGEGMFQFEHFTSKKELELEQNKFLALSQKLGVHLTLENTRQSGQPIPDGSVHRDFLKGES